MTIQATGYGVLPDILRGNLALVRIAVGRVTAVTWTSLESHRSTSTEVTGESSIASIDTGIYIKVDLGV